MSTIRSTEPVGYTDQPRFVNGAVLLETSLEPLALMQALLEIERRMGRVREGAVRKGPRIIDLDLLLYDGTVLSTSDLTLPHPLMHERAFVLEPLAEIAPEMHHPIFNTTIRALLTQLEERLLTPCKASL